MDIKSILIATVVVALVGLIIAILLSVAEKVFHVDIDEREAKIRAELAGNNCGGCGYAGCDALAKAIASGEAPADACPVSGKDASEKIAKIMGAEIGEYVRKTAYIKCTGSCSNRNKDYNYFGITSCKSESVAPGTGMRSCDYGCLGHGSCAKVCEQKAIRIVDGIAEVDQELCIACGKCLKECPMDLIEFVPYNSKYRVGCSNKEKGKKVKLNCDAGCIGCGLCERNCPSGAITVVNNIAKIDYEKCTSCGICKDKCPTKVISLFE